MQRTTRWTETGSQSHQKDRHSVVFDRTRFSSSKKTTINARRPPSVFATPQVKRSAESRTLLRRKSNKAGRKRRLPGRSDSLKRIEAAVAASAWRSWLEARSPPAPPRPADNRAITFLFRPSTSRFLFHVCSENQGETGGRERRTRYLVPQLPRYAILPGA